MRSISDMSDSDNSQQDLNSMLYGKEPQNKINQYMEDFYDRNYYKYEMFNMPDY